MPKVKNKSAGIVANSGRTERTIDYYARAVERAEATRRPLVEPNNENPLGGATADELAAVLSAELGNDPNLEAPETVIAVESLAQVIAARMANVDSASDPRQLAVFIVSDRARDLGSSLEAELEPIIDNGSRSLTGKLWLTAPTLVSGYFAYFTSTEPSGVFDEVNSKGLGNMSAFVFDPSATDPEIRYYPDGLNQVNRVQRFLIAEKTFTMSALDKVLKRLHEEHIITPDAALPEFNPWADGKKYVPRERAEAFLQAILQVMIGIFFDKCRVHFEFRGTEGRCDLLVSSKHPTTLGAWIFHAALELKVLRSFTSKAKPVSTRVRRKAVSEGLLQAIAYKRENSAQDGLLCCFDMRAPKQYDGTACFNPIAQRAKRSKIELRHYRLYGTSADYRMEKYGRGSSST